MGIGHPPGAGGHLMIAIDYLLSNPRSVDWKPSTSAMHGNLRHLVWYVEGS